MWPRRDACERAARAVADGCQPDWDAIEVDGNARQWSTIQHLKSLARGRPGQVRSGPDRLPGGPGLTVVAAVAAAQAFSGLAAGIGTLALHRLDALPPIQFPITLLVFFAAGSVLLLGAHRSAAAVRLGVLCLLVASAFSGPLVRAFADVTQAAPWWSRWATAICPDAFLPAIVFSFVVEFPEMPGFARLQVVTRLGCAAAWGTGALLFAANVALVWTPGPLPAIEWLDRARPLSSAYWTIVFASVLVAFGLALFKSRRALGDDRDRTRWLLLAVAAGGTPMALASLMAAGGSPFQPWVTAHRIGIGVAAYLFLLSIPVSTGYLITARRVLDVSPRSLAYTACVALAAAISWIPVIALGSWGYRHRHETSGRLAGDWGLAVVVGCAVLAAGGALLSRPSISLLRLWFFRERPDVGAAVSSLARVAGDEFAVGDVTGAVEGAIDEALHPARVDVLVLEPTSGNFVPVAEGRLPSMPASSAIASVAATAREPVSMDLEGRRGLARLLPESERQWLVDAGCRLVVPLSGLDGSLVAIGALGPKRSGLPYSASDRRFLAALSAPASSLIQRCVSRADISAQVGHRDQPAFECDRCGRIREAGATCCADARLIPSCLPGVLFGKYRMEGRIGRGGMGVVYLARDTRLDRCVAIKTLPHLSTVASVRLHREARAMATVIHPHLSVLLGFETWRGLPLLVMEYLQGGTLAARLVNGPLAPDGAVELALAVSEGLECMHQVCLVHRDVKPSNIGFQHGDVPKLLDFGLARILTAARSEGGGDGAEGDEVLGTPAYLPPEALDRRIAAPSWDLWGLALVLYECVAGLNPLLGRDVSETMARVARAEIPDVREFAPACPPPLALFFERALSADARRRPASASAFRASLRVGHQRRPV